MYQLYIANKNYSSWSLRPWMLLRQLRIAFQEHLVPFNDAAAWNAYRKIAPSGKVPCLVDGSSIVWDSLAIIEYLAERHEGVWPSGTQARAWARSAAAEMHSGFAELRSRCSMSCGVRVKLHEFTPALKRDLERIASIWAEGLKRFGGPFLAGAEFSAVDAFYAPVVLRIQTYNLEVDAVSSAYVARLLNLDAVKEWYAAGLNEKFRDAPHDLEIEHFGTLLQDLRTPAAG